MSFTYTNRKGVTYTLYRTLSKSGQPQYTFALQSRGEPVAELPPGFHISESPNGRVSLLKDRPSLISPDAVAAVEAAIAAHPRGNLYRLVVKPNRIDIYAPEGWYGGKVHHEGYPPGLTIPDREQLQHEIWEELVVFAPVLRFILHDRERQAFRAEGLVAGGIDDYWLVLEQTGSLAELAQTLVPALGAETSRSFYASIVMPPQSDSPAASIGATGRQRQLGSVHRLKVTLLGLRPPIWRRFVVPSEITLNDLHAVLQATMGWDNSHLHDFRVGAVSYGDPRLLEGLQDEDSRKARLGQIAPVAKRRFRYLYDFGDSWEHEILVEAVTPPAPGIRYPICLTGKRATPPEDSGGVWGFSDLIEAVSDPENTEREDLLEWLGGPFDTEAFDLEEVNRRLEPFQRRRSW